MENVSRHYNRLKKSRLFCFETLEWYSLSRKCCIRAVSQKMNYICEPAVHPALVLCLCVSLAGHCPAVLSICKGQGGTVCFFLRASTIDPQLLCPKACPCPSQSCPAQLVNDDLSGSMPEPIVRLRQSHSAEPTVYHLQQLLLLQLYYISDLSQLCIPCCKVQFGDWFTMCAQLKRRLC